MLPKKNRKICVVEKLLITPVALVAGSLQSAACPRKEDEANDQKRKRCHLTSLAYNVYLFLK